MQALRLSVVSLVAIGTLAGCASITPRDNPPVRTWVVGKDLDQATSCVINALNAEGHSSTALAPSITHAAQIIVPNAVYEVRPQQEITLTAEIYYVKLSKVAASSSRIELFAISTWASRMAKAVERCAT